MMSLRVALMSAVVCAFSVGSVGAVSSMPGYLKNGYKENSEYKSFFETVDAMKSKCDVCHIPGSDKKAKGHGLNDFGKVYHEHFNDKDYKTADKLKKTEEAMKLFKDAWEKSIKHKNADGKEFFELIKEGKNPGKND